MSALAAVELPEQAAALYDEPADLLAIVAAVTAPPAVRPVPPRGRTASVPPRAQAASIPLRLTRRGRIVIGVAVVVLLAALSLVAAVSAQATSQAPAGPGRGVVQLTVQPGQSLWSVAESADPGADTRAVVQQIVELNSLTGSAIFAGQRLWVPRG
jgi:hypothetical protein